MTNNDMNITQDVIWENNTSAHNELSQNHETTASHIAKPNCRAFYARFLNKILNDNRIHQSKVLEIGCGTASYSSMFNGQYVGIDLSEGMIGVAKRRNPDKEFHISSAEDYLSKGGKYSLIFSSSFLHHIFSLEELVSQIYDSLEPGGHYVALHEPLTCVYDDDKTPISEFLDNAFSGLNGWDIPKQSFGRRLGDFLKHMTFPLWKKPASHEEEIDLVDYQLNLDFSPTKISNFFAKEGGKVELIVYSYFRYPIISKLFGGSKNFFSVVVTKPE